MITTADKAIVSLIMAGLTVANVVFGQHLPINQDVITSIVSVAAPILVFLVPNKKS